MNSIIDLGESSLRGAVIKVIGIGGGGGNALAHMLAHNIEGVEFFYLNTDAQALKSSQVENRIQLGEAITKGLGAGANPEVGRQAAELDRERIRSILEGADMVFITAGMGGGTGTGAAPVIAEIAKELGVLTVAIVTKPFLFEGRKRLILAEEGIKNLSQFVDSLIIVPNNKLINVLGKKVTLLDAFKEGNNILLDGVRGIAELITRTGLINVDFADARTVMSEKGMAVLGTGLATGEERARKAAEVAIASPLLEDVVLAGARGVLVNITAGLNLTIGEFEEVGEVIKGFISEEATVVVGTVIDPELTDELRVTIVITGLGKLPNSLSAIPSTISNLDGLVDYQQLERPTVLRKQGVSSQSKVGTESGVSTTAMDYLDIPAFLRKQEEVS